MKEIIPENFAIMLNPAQRRQMNLIRSCDHCDHCGHCDVLINYKPDLRIQLTSPTSVQVGDVVMFTPGSAD